jgi:hypothetical protein
MRHTIPTIRRNPEPYVPSTPDPEPVSQKYVSKKIKNLPFLESEKQARRLVNDQALLQQLWTKLSLHSIRPEPVSEVVYPNPEPILNPDPEPETKRIMPSVLNPKPESEPKRMMTLSILNQTSAHETKVEPTNSAPLLYLPAKLKNVDLHFMIDSGATNNFLSQDLVKHLNLSATKLKNPVHISFADGRIQSIQRYVLLRNVLHCRYRPQYLPRTTLASIC